MSIESVLQQLELVETKSLPKGALFWVNGRLYQVIESARRGFERGRGWRMGEETDVALVKGSILSQRLPLIERGYHLPTYISREALLNNGKPQQFVFPVEQTALDAAHLDVSLCSGLYVRRHARFPAFEATNGVLVVRVYFFSRTNQGMQTKLPDIKERISGEIVPHYKGSAYWKLLASWDESPYDLTQTQAIRPVDIANRLEDTLPSSALEETLNNLRIVKPDDEETKKG